MKDERDENEDPVQRSIEERLNEKRSNLLREFLKLNDPELSAKDIASWVMVLITGSAALLSLAQKEHPRHKTSWAHLLNSSLYLLEQLRKDEFENL